MVTTGDTVLGVWRLGVYRRTIGYVLAVPTAISAVTTWLALLLHPDSGHLVTAGEATAAAVVTSLFSWCVLLRVRLELTTAGVTTVNPWGTHHLPWSDVSTITLTASGARFHTSDGFTYTASALSGIGRLEPQASRFAEVLAVARTRVST